MTPSSTAADCFQQRSTTLNLKIQSSADSLFVATTLAGGIEIGQRDRILRYSICTFGSGLLTHDDQQNRPPKIFPRSRQSLNQVFVADKFVFGQMREARVGNGLPI